MFRSKLQSVRGSKLFSYLFFSICEGSFDWKHINSLCANLVQQILGAAVLDSEDIAMH